MKNSFNLVGHIEKDAQRFCYSNQLQIQLKVIEDRKQHTQYGDLMNSNSFDSYSGGFNVSNTLKVPAFQSSFRVVSTTSPNCVSVTQIDIRGSKLHKTPLA